MAPILSEKSSYLPPPPRLTHNERKLQIIRRLICSAGVCALTLWAVTGWYSGVLFPTPTPPRADTAFKWSAITPSPELRWNPCFGGLECARLQVPLDYTNASDPRTVAIALTKVHASVPETSPEWSGPLLINPGGPGGSGVALAIASGRDLQMLAGRTHSIIGFDPRGVSNTTPTTTCFPTLSSRMIWWLRAGSRVVGYSSDPQALAVEYARSISLGSLCDSNIAAGSGADFAGTPNVARDMLAITEASWRSVGVDPSTRGLRLWGFSYGTLLGQTFASMFPDRVERLVLDGVVDPDDYYASEWKKNLQDSEKVVQRFYTYCSRAGPACAFSAPTPELVEKRLKNLMEKVRIHPVAVEGEGAPDWVTDADVRTMVFVALYSPIALFPFAAESLAALERGDASQLVRFVHPPFDCDCALEQGPNTGLEAASAIVCQDGGGRNSTLEEFVEYVDELKGQSDMTGGNWASIQMACVGLHWPARGLVPSREGGVSGWNGRPWGAETKHPILFASSKYDPVTPVRNAVKMVERFRGAGLLVQEGVGHCAVSVPSVCLLKTIGRYFMNGVVAGKVECPADMTPWGVQGEDKVVGEEYVVLEEDVEVKEAAERLARGWRVLVPGKL